MRPNILDIDFDFFFSDEKTIIENPAKKIWLSPPSFFGQIRVQPVAIIQHHEVLFHLDAYQIKNAAYYHLDAHHDLFTDGKRIDALPYGLRAGFPSEANYLAFAIRDGIIGKLISVCPDWADPTQRAEELKDILGCFSDRVSFLRLSDIREELKCLQIDYCFCALSPTFTPPSYDAIFADVAGGTLALLEPASNLRQSELFSGHPERGFQFYYNLATDGLFDSLPLFHGTDRQSLKTLNPADGRSLFFSPSPGFAACFGAHPTNENGWVHGMDYLTEEWPFAYMVVPRMEALQLNQPFSLYSTYAENVTKPYSAGCVRGMEFASTQPVTIIHETEYNSIQDGLNLLGVCIAQTGNKMISDPDILKYLALFSVDVEKHFEMPAEAIQGLLHMEPLLYQYFVAQKKLRPSCFKPSYRKFWLNLLYRVFLPGAFPFSKVPHNGYHGMEHCSHVARYAAYFSLSLDEDPTPAMVAGVLHDMMRTDDIESEKHAEDGAVMAETILRNYFTEFVNASDFAVIVEAIRSHTLQTDPINYVDACLRDSDRLRLAWEHGYNESFFSTSCGRAAARHGYVYLQNHFNHYFQDKLLELKTEITEQCNLTCSFCHQTFGMRKARTNLSVRKFEKIVFKAKQDGISMLRLTGGEPLLHRELATFAEIAKQNGLYVTVNTNATVGKPERYLQLAKFVDCFKISLPFPDESMATQSTGTSNVWEKKLEVLGHLYAFGIKIEVLTVMTPTNINEYERFIDLLDPLESIRWLPLRAEPNSNTPRPVSTADINELARKIILTKSGSERWADLFLHLAIPFCVLEAPQLAPQVFTGRRTCGPIQSLTITSAGTVISCYSERSPLDAQSGFEKTASSCVHNDFSALPICCQTCTYGYICNGGCRTALVLQESEYGKLDYLAYPDRIIKWMAHDA